MTDHKLSQQALHDKLEQARGLVAVGATYRHYKGSDYTVLDVAILEASNEVAVIYQAQYGQQLTFIRPLDDWLADLVYEGKHLKRFTK